MDFSFSEEQEAVRELAGRIFTDLATHERLRELESEPDGDRFDRKLWAELAAAGLLGIALPEEVGGAGLGFVETGLLVEAAGPHRGLRAGHRDPGGRGAGHRPVRHRGPAPALAPRRGGRARRCSPPPWSSWAVPPGSPSVVAERDGDGWALSGVEGLRALGDDRRRRAGAGPGRARRGGRVHRRDVGRRGEPPAPGDQHRPARGSASRLAGTPVGRRGPAGIGGGGRADRRVAGPADHRRHGPGPGRGGRGRPGPGGRVHQDARAVRQAHRHLPGRGPAGRRRLRRHRGHPAHRLAGGLADRPRGCPPTRRWPSPSSGRPTAASGWSTPPSTSTAGWASTATTRCTGTS